MSPRLRRLLLLLGVAALYYAAARLGLLLAVGETNATPVWPPSGIALALTLILGWRVLPGIFVGAFLANAVVFSANAAASMGTILFLSLTIAAGNTLEASIGRVLLGARRAAADCVRSVGGVAWFIGAGAGACAVAATIGVSGLAAAGLTEHVPWSFVWLTWWLGDTTSVLVLTPLVLVWTERRRAIDSPRWLEGTVLLLLLVVAGVVGFEWVPLPEHGDRLTFLMIPLLVVLAVRLDPRFAAAGVAVASSIAVVETLRGFGPFALVSVEESLLLQQAYIAILAAMVLTLAAAMDDRRRSMLAVRELNESLERRVAERSAVAEHRAEQLRALASDLASTEERERRRLARVLHDHLQQLLVASRLRLRNARYQLEGTDEAGLAELQRTDDLLSEAIGASREVTVELSPPVLQEGGLATALDWLAREAGSRHGLRVEVHADESIEPVDEGSRLLAFHAVRELLLNVVKHAEATEARVVAERTDPERVRIVVSDAGRGFDLAATPVGFGLFALRERIEWLGGKVDVRSEPQGGTSVRIELPTTAPRVAPSAAGATPARPVRDGATPQVAGAKIRVVLADDHRLFREGLAALLEQEPDLTVVGQAGDGEEAVRLARYERPDVVIMDVNMPRVGGLDATRQIRELFPDMKVIGLSMYESADMAAAMRAAGANAYLTKDQATEALSEVIRSSVTRSVT